MGAERHPRFDIRHLQVGESCELLRGVQRAGASRLEAYATATGLSELHKLNGSWAYLQIEHARILMNPAGAQLRRPRRKNISCQNSNA